MQVALQFYPNQKNPARASGRGVYRVVAFFPVSGSAPIRVEHYFEDDPILFMRTVREFKCGSRVDPLKIALAARRAA